MRSRANSDSSVPSGSLAKLCMSNEKSPLSGEIGTLNHLASLLPVGSIQATQTLPSADSEIVALGMTVPPSKRGRPPMRLRAGSCRFIGFFELLGVLGEKALAIRGER